ncbi:MAG: DsbA family protein [Planctomycetes bacterium]|nr:DsbA family protein [Planctomycetota bacterium]
MSHKNIYYILDPMCSWCWGFRNTFLAFQESLNPAEVTLHYLMGGLAPDNDQPMPQAMREMIQQHWQSVQHRTGAQFNVDFWSSCTPRRSTWLSCRAVIATGLQDKKYIPQMIYALQKAYYLEAQNPSDLDTILNCAQSLDIDHETFAADLDSEKVHTLFQEQRKMGQDMGISGFPALVVKDGDQLHNLSSGYLDIDTLLSRWHEMSP